MAHDETQPYGEPARDAGGADGIEHTAPIWYDQHPAPSPHQGDAPPGQHSAAYGPYPPAAGDAPGSPTAQATLTKPPKSRRWAELTAVASLAAVLASGGTYAATQLGSPDTQTSSTALSSSSLGRGVGSTTTVVQADSHNPNWTATSAVVAPSVVAITVTSGNSGAQGSGVIIDGSGHILTNNHVVAAGSKISVTLHDGRTYPATVAGTDPSTDLAVLTVKGLPSDVVPIAIGNSDNLKVGDPVMAIGNPLGLAGTVTTGIVSALDRPVSTTPEPQQPQNPDPFGQQQQNPNPGQQQAPADPVVTNAIQTSAAINPGNSGGALVNASGQLVGINSAIASLGSGSGGQSGSIGIGFAIPVNEAKSIAGQLIKSGSAQHALLGVRSSDGTASDGNAQRTGAQVAAVVPGTPAASAGLRTGEVIIAVDGHKVDGADSLVATVRERSVGDTVTLTVLRNGKRLELHAKLVAQPTSNT